MQDFEKLGVFYLGREYDLATRQPKPELVLYDSKDLTTHAVCVGMTGSGKTGLCLALLEEAAIDSVPAIAIDPKGDLGNLLLTFPELRPEDFRPWVEEGEAARQGISLDELAAHTASQWREGLAAWGEDGERIRRLRAAADVALYTPGSSAGLPLAVLKSFAAPSAALLADTDALREKISAAVSGLLTLAGIDADPIRSREHILLSQLLEQAWKKSRDLDLGALVRDIQSPPFDRVGFVDLETFFPAKQRFELAMTLNNLLASPGFAGWLEGEPLDVGRLLFTAEGRPRLSILSIAHLSDAERMFFVTILLNEVLAWARSQSGTSSLRAILYMDEIYGYFPPTANPPSKTPMLTLLKQARAHGLGIVLATQNPVDLDYKGLANAGTWFLGRLQTERDKARVLEGLEGASTAAGSTFDRGAMEATLAGLGNRVFLMNNVHENHPVTFQSRWCLSYLRGPLTRGQIQTLMAPRKQAAQVAATQLTANQSSPEKAAEQATPKPAAAPPPNQRAASQRPLVPPEAGECFVKRRDEVANQATVYQPALLGVARLHFVDVKSGVDHWQEFAVLAKLANGGTDNVWDVGEVVQENGLVLSQQPEQGASFASLPATAARPRSYATWQKALSTYLYSSQSLKLSSAPAFKEVSRPGETEGDFRVRLLQQARERRDEAVDKLRKRYAPKATTLENQIRRAKDRVDVETTQFQNQATSTVLSIGSSIVRALTGRKWLTTTSVTGAATAARSASRAAQQRGDISRAERNLEDLRAKLSDLESQIQTEIAHMDDASEQPKLEEYLVRPRKTDTSVQKVVLAWLPA